MFANLDAYPPCRNATEQTCRHCGGLLPPGAGWLVLGRTDDTGTFAQVVCAARLEEIRAAGARPQ